MSKIMTAVLSGAIALSSLAGAALARDNDRNRDAYRERSRHVTAYCTQHPRSQDCGNWRRSGRNWGDSDYRGFYQRNYRNNNDQALAALFGFVAGAAIVSQSQRQYGWQQGTSRLTWAEGRSPHQRACASRYDSYDSRSDSFEGRDGRRYYCELRN